MATNDAKSEGTDLTPSIEFGIVCDLSCKVKFRNFRRLHNIAVTLDSLDSMFLHEHGGRLRRPRRPLGKPMETRACAPTTVARASSSDGSSACPRTPGRQAGPDGSAPRARRRSSRPSFEPASPVLVTTPPERQSLGARISSRWPGATTMPDRATCRTTMTSHLVSSSRRAQVTVTTVTTSGHDHAPRRLARRRTIATRT